MISPLLSERVPGRSRGREIALEEKTGTYVFARIHLAEAAATKSYDRGSAPLPCAARKNCVGRPSVTNIRGRWRLGGCLCNSVRYSAKAEPAFFVVCQCEASASAILNFGLVLRIRSHHFLTRPRPPAGPSVPVKLNTMFGPTSASWTIDEPTNTYGGPPNIAPKSRCGGNRMAVYFPAAAG